MIKNTENFGARLKRLIDQTGLTQKKFAAEVKITEAALSTYIVKNSIPRVDIFYRIAKFFNLTMEEILLGNKEVEAGTANVVPFKKHKSHFPDDPHFQQIRRDIIQIWKSGNLQHKIFVTQAVNMCIRPETSLTSSAKTDGDPFP